MRFREEYKRYQLRDIQAIAIAQRPRFHISTRAFGIAILWLIAFASLLPTTTVGLFRACGNCHSVVHRVALCFGDRAVAPAGSTRPLAATNCLRSIERGWPQVSARGGTRNCRGARRVGRRLDRCRREPERGAARDLAARIRRSRVRAGSEFRRSGACPCDAVLISYWWHFILRWPMARVGPLSPGATGSGESPICWRCW